MIFKRKLLHFVDVVCVWVPLCESVRERGKRKNSGVNGEGGEGRAMATCSDIT